MSNWQFIQELLKPGENSEAGATWSPLSAQVEEGGKIRVVFFRSVVGSTVPPTKLHAVKDED